MTLGHEKLDAYRLSIEYVAGVYEITRGSVLECAAHGRAGIDFDPDSDSDLDGMDLQPAQAGYARKLAPRCATFVRTVVLVLSATVLVLVLERDRDDRTDFRS